MPDTSTMEDAVFRRIAEAIDDHGPITFAEYMDLALYGPDGYYERAPIGPEADFVTSPHVHPVFGAFLADAIRELWGGLGEPRPFHVIEVGAGDGTLLRQILPDLADLDVRAIAVERSARARRQLEDIGDVEVADAIPEHPGLVLAHEVLDNLPFRRISGTSEVRVGMDGGRLVELPVPASRELMALAEARAASASMPGEAIVPIGATAFVRDALAHGPRYVLAIDYGSARGAVGPPHGYRGHRVVDDLLTNPGRTDITAGVDFGLIAEAVRQDGSTAFADVSQRDALIALGFAAWVTSQMERQQDLLATGRGAEAVRTWGGRSRATILVDPAGLGRFRWFLAATHGLGGPDWLRRASAQRAQPAGPW
jgi:SAM-dependent MidA family methyltransferase